MGEVEELKQRISDLEAQVASLEQYAIMADELLVARIRNLEEMAQGRKGQRFARLTGDPSNMTEDHRAKLNQLSR